MYLRFVATAAGIISLGVGSASLGADRVVDRTFEAPAGGRLKVELDGGSIVVVGTDAPQVVVQLRARGRESEIEKLIMTAEQDASGVHVIGKRKAGPLNWIRDANVDAKIEVPRNYSLELSGAGGAIDLKHVDGGINVRSSGGSLRFESLGGEIHARTSGGTVDARSIRGPLQVHTSGGAIAITEIEKGVDARTSGGSIRLERASGPIEVRTTGGNIDVELVGENAGIDAKTSGGVITLRLPSATKAALNASAPDGRVKSDLPVIVQESGNSVLRGTINGGGPEIFARSSGGIVSLQDTK